ncbi:MAG: type II toxin-antitoxin system prevent-host-death family antitoxin [Proteobacteria bacterium]|nr:type II toxin-antitoxin system prevent-host-death family antitoxin [Pseudomonadota bacterium]
MKTIDILTAQNNFGGILEALNKTGEPVLLSKKSKIKAVLITPEDFKRRFVDVQAEDDKRAFLENIKTPPAMEDFDRLIADTRKKVRQAGIKPSDITAAISKVRGRK